MSNGDKSRLLRFAEELFSAIPEGSLLDAFIKTSVGNEISVEGVAENLINNFIDGLSNADEEFVSAVQGIILSLFGEDFIDKPLDALASVKGIDWMSDLIGKAWGVIIDNPVAEEAAETAGELVMGPVLRLFERYADDEGEPIEDFMVAFAGVNILMSLPKLIIALTESEVLATKLGPISKVFEQVYWTLGLGFLGWMTLSPILQAGLLKRLERHYNSIYFPKRFAPNDLIALFYAGHVSLPELIKGFEEEGWSRDKVPAIIDTSYRSLSRSDIKELYDAGDMSLQDVLLELAKNGYNPKYIKTIADTIINDGTGVDKNPTASDIKKAYKNNLIGRVAFVEWLRTLGYSGEAISLQLALIDLDRQSKQRELALSQVKAAYVVGRLRRVETTAYLQTLNYAVEDIGIILDTWDAEKAPKVLKLNAGSITKYLRSGTLNRTQAEQKLLDLGYTPGDVQIIIQDTLLKANVGSKPITVSYLMQARSIGALTDSELTTRLKALGVPQSDISIYIQLASHKELGALTVNDIERAYKTDIISAQAAIEQQLSIGADRTLAEQRLATWEAERERTRYRLTPATLSLALKQKQISDTQAYGYLRDLGLSDSDAKLIVQVATSITPRSFNQTEVKELYLNYVVDRAKAVSLLEQTGLSRDNAALSVQAWDSLIAKEIPTPSIQQLLSANRDGVLSDAEFESKLRDMRLSTDTTQFYLRLSEQETVEATKELTKADIVGMYADEVLPYYEALERLIDNGYTPDDAMLLLKRKEKRLEDSLLHSLLINGSISGENFIYEAENAGYTLDEIADYFDRLGV